MNGRGLLGIVLAVLLIAVLVLAVLFLIRGREAPSSPAPAPSTTGSRYDVYFTSPTYPDRPETRVGGIDERFVEFVDAAVRTLDVAAYDSDLENVALAMARARNRGVSVRMVTDSDTLDNRRDEGIRRAIDLVSGAGIPIVADERRSIMHHKFAIRDGEEVWTGSWNLTVGDTYRLNNNAARLRSGELAAAYRREFETMFVEREFGSAKRAGPPPPPVDVGGARVQALFSPDNGVAGRIAEWVAASGRQVRFLAFSFTHDGLAQAVLERAGAGAEVAGVFEPTGPNTRFSEFGRMKQAGLAVFQDGNQSGTQWRGDAALDRPRGTAAHLIFVLDGGRGWA